MMSLKKLMIIATLALGALNACGDKKAKENISDASVEDKAVPEMTKETSKIDAEIKATKKSAVDSLRKVDSLKQVKQHGHAH